MSTSNRKTSEGILLREYAFARSGDKGNISNVVVIPFDETNYDWLCTHLTTDVVKAWFGSLVKGSIERYEMKGIRALNFVMQQALEGGVSRSLNLDTHGKSRGNYMLGMRLSAPKPPAPPRLAQSD